MNELAENSEAKKAVVDWMKSVIESGQGLTVTVEYDKLSESQKAGITKEMLENVEFNAGVEYGVSWAMRLIFGITDEDLNIR